jgi:hypothetical protein
MKKMIVTQISPSIPDSDWQAYWDGDEGSRHAGYGATKEEAIADLKRVDQERWEASLEGDEYQ